MTTTQLRLLTVLAFATSVCVVTGGFWLLHGRRPAVPALDRCDAMCSENDAEVIAFDLNQSGDLVSCCCAPVDDSLYAE